MYWQDSYRFFGWYKHITGNECHSKHFIQTFCVFDIKKVNTLWSHQLYLFTSDSNNCRSLVIQLYSCWYNNRTFNSSQRISNFRKKPTSLNMYCLFYSGLLFVYFSYFDVMLCIPRLSNTNYFEIQKYIFRARF